MQKQLWPRRGNRSIAAEVHWNGAGYSAADLGRHGAGESRRHLWRLAGAHVDWQRDIDVASKIPVSRRCCPVAGETDVVVTGSAAERAAEAASSAR